MKKYQSIFEKKTTRTNSLKEVKFFQIPRVDLIPLAKAVQRKLSLNRLPEFDILRERRIQFVIDQFNDYSSELSKYAISNKPVTIKSGSLFADNDFFLGTMFIDNGTAKRYKIFQFEYDYVTKEWEVNL